MKRTQILGVGFDHITMEQALNKLDEFMTLEKPHLAITANPEMVMRVGKDQLLAEIMEKADLVVADGIGVVWASALLKDPVPQRIPGIELAEGLLHRAAEEGRTVFLLGGAAGVAQKAAAHLQKILPELRIVGTHHGYFQGGADEQQVIAAIKDAKPHILLAALGFPRQEKWLAAHLGTLKVPVAVGVGGSFNVWAGVDKRAPEWMRKIHLEWFYRLIKQPWRIKRMAILPVFVCSVLRTRIIRGGEANG